MSIEQAIAKITELKTQLTTVIAEVHGADETRDRSKMIASLTTVKDLYIKTMGEVGGLVPKGEHNAILDALKQTVRDLYTTVKADADRLHGEQAKEEATQKAAEEAALKEARKIALEGLVNRGVHIELSGYAVD